MSGRADRILSQHRRLGAALSAVHAPQLVARGVRVAFNGVWLGLASADDLRALDERYYAGSDMYRTPEWNEQGLFGWEKELVGRHFPAGGRVLVAACGGGREVLGLLEAGFDALGEEPHEALVRYADGFLSERGHPGRVRAAPRDGFSASDDRFDALVVGWGALSLVHGRAGRVAFLAGARERLVPGAPVLLSFFETAVDGRELRWTRRVAGVLRAARRTGSRELGDVLAPNLVHVLTRERLEEELALAGLELCELKIVAQATDEATRYAAAVATVPA